MVRGCDTLMIQCGFGPGKGARPCSTREVGNAISAKEAWDFHFFLANQSSLLEPVMSPLKFRGLDKRKAIFIYGHKRVVSQNGVHLWPLCKSSCSIQLAVFFLNGECYHSSRKPARPARTICLLSPPGGGPSSQVSTRNNAAFVEPCLDG